MAKKTGNIGIHTQNLLPIIKKWLYSEHDIFLRELVSNAYDAISKLKHLKMMGEFTGDEPEYKINIHIDEAAKTITISDNGLGLTEEEVEKYISQVAFSGAKDFVEKYEQVGEAKDLIGFFGLGFYSSFMVAHTVEIKSLSYQKGAKAVYWKSEGNETFEIDSCDKKDIGTEITLHLDSENESFLKQAMVESTVKKYSQFLSVPISINDTVIPQQDALWRKNPSEITDDQYKNLFHQLFPQKVTDPIFHFHIKTDYPFEVQGIFYFPKVTQQADPSQGNIKLFVKDVFVGEGLKEITPEFLSPLLGVIESSDIPLNVSRSQLQGDIRIKKIASHIESKFADRFIQLFKEDREKLKEIWKDIHMFIKFGCMQQDSFFTKIKDYLLFETSDGELLTLNEYKEKYPKLPQKEDKTLLFYLEKDKSFSSYKDMFEDKNTAILTVDSPFDSHLFSFLETKDTSIQFARIDSELNDFQYSSSEEITQEKKESFEKIFKELLEEDQLLIDVKSLKNENLPLRIITNEQMRRFEEMSVLMRQGMDMNANELLGKTLVINPDNKAIQKIMLLEATDKKKAKELANQALDLALLETGSLSEKRKEAFIKRSTELLKDL